MKQESSMAAITPHYWKLTGAPSLFSVSEIFHENSKIRKGASSFVISAEAAHAMSEGFKSYDLAAPVCLPQELSLEKEDLAACILSRKSARTYSDDPLTLSHISTFLTYSCRELSGSRHRTAPSAGALFPLEAYAICINVDGLAPDIYHYGVRGHQLEPLHRADKIEDIRRAIFVPEIAQTAALIWVITAIFGRTKIKYGERGYRFALLEAGHLAQNMCLVGSAMKLSTCPIGGYVDDLINGALGVDGVEEAALYMISAGIPPKVRS